MSKKTVVYSHNRTNWGQERIVPIVGKVHIGNQGEIEVESADMASKLISAAPGLFGNNPLGVQEAAADGIQKEEVKANADGNVIELTESDVNAQAAEIAALKDELAAKTDIITSLEGVITELSAKISELTGAADAGGQQTLPLSNAGGDEAGSGAGEGGAGAGTGGASASGGTSDEKYNEALGKLKDKKKPDLVSMCTRAGLPESEWGELTVPELKDYLAKKAAAQA